MFPFNRWFDYEFIVQQSSSAGVPDGSVTIQIDGIQKTSASGLTTYAPGGGIFRYMLMGGTIASCTDSAGTVQKAPNYRIYYDDVYVDDTQARIEVCDSATWSSRTHCEVQPPTTWSDSQIAYNLNYGTFSAGDTGYIFVIDTSGILHSGGALTF